MNFVHCSEILRPFLKHVLVLPSTYCANFFIPCFWSFLIDNPVIFHKVNPLQIFEMIHFEGKEIPFRNQASHFLYSGRIFGFEEFTSYDKKEDDLIEHGRNDLLDIFIWQNVRHSRSTSINAYRFSCLDFHALAECLNGRHFCFHRALLIKSHGFANPRNRYRPAVHDVARCSHMTLILFFQFPYPVRDVESTNLCKFHHNIWNVLVDVNMNGIYESSHCFRSIRLFEPNQSERNCYSNLLNKMRNIIENQVTISFRKHERFVKTSHSWASIASQSFSEILIIRKWMLFNGFISLHILITFIWKF